MRRSARIVIANVKFLLSLAMAVQYTARSVFQNEKSAARLNQDVIIGRKTGGLLKDILLINIWIGRSVDTVKRGDRFIKGEEIDRPTRFRGEGRKTKIPTYL
jgi:hypothetical protein